MTSAELSQMLFLARESVEMFADVVEGRTGVPDAHNRELVTQIDAFREARGWKRYGFGGETEEETEWAVQWADDREMQVMAEDDARYYAKGFRLGDRLMRRSVSPWEAVTTDD